MAGLFPMKMKRKEIDEVNHDFSDFSLASPARKIRRLDAELQPIIEEEPENPVRFEPSMMAEDCFPSRLEQVRGPIIEELPENEERAIVLYNSAAATTPLLQSPSNYYSVDPKFLSGLKSQLLLSSQSSGGGIKSAEDEEAAREDSNATSSGCLAVVPWAPSLLSPTAEPEEAEVGEMMDAEDTEATTMDIEGGGGIVTNNIPGQGFGYGVQQQQQHCMMPPGFAQSSTSTPVVWFQ